MKTWTAARIKELRGWYGETQAVFACRVGVHPDTLRTWEQGRITPEGPAALILSRLEEDIASGRPRPHPHLALAGKS